MRPQRQLIDHCPEDGRYGDCQRTCIAAILDMDASEVPHFCAPPLAPKGDPDWWENRQNRWLSRFGLATMTVAYSGDTATFEDVMDWTSRQSPTVPMILCGKGGKGVNHVVVVLNGEIVCDPSGSGIVGPTLENTWEVQVLAATRRVTSLGLTEKEEDTIGDWYNGGSATEALAALRTRDEAEAAMREKAAADYQFPYWLCGCPLCRERARRETPTPHDQNTREASDE